MTDRVCSSVGSQAAYTRPYRDKHCSTQQWRRRDGAPVAFLRPKRALWTPSRIQCQSGDADDKKLDLLRQEETSDGAILFVFGDAEESAEAVIKDKVKAESGESAPEPEPAPKQAKKKAGKSPIKSEAESPPQEEAKKSKKGASKSGVPPPEDEKANVSPPKSELVQETEKEASKSAPEPKVASHKTKADAESSPKVEAALKKTTKKDGESASGVKVTSQDAGQDDPSKSALEDQNTEPSSHLSNNLSETLADMTVVQLKKKCKDAGMKGYSRLKKGELIDALQDVIKQGRSETAVL